MPVMGADQFVGNFAYCNARYRSLDFCFYLFQPFFDMGEACSCLLYTSDAADE